MSETYTHFEVRRHVEHGIWVAVWIDGARTSTTSRARAEEVAAELGSSVTVFEVTTTTTPRGLRWFNEPTNGQEAWHLYDGEEGFGWATKGQSAPWLANWKLGRPAMACGSLEEAKAVVEAAARERFA